MTTVYNINNDGIISEVGLYSLGAYKALKAAFLQTVRHNYNTWNYDNIDLPIKETIHGYTIFYNDNSCMYVRNK